MLYRGLLVSGSSFGFAVDSTRAQPEDFTGIDTQAPAPSGESPFVTLMSGVRVKDIKQGSGETAKADSTVSIQCNGRLLNLNGVSFYNTKNNKIEGTDFVEPLIIKLGSGSALPGLEEGIVGMTKGGIRRIIVPAEFGYSKFPGLEPIPKNALDQQALDSVIRNPRRDATLLFDVKLEKIK